MWLGKRHSVLCRVWFDLEGGVCSTRHIRVRSAEEGNGKGGATTFQRLSCAFLGTTFAAVSLL